MTARLLPVYLEADSPPESFARQLDELVRLAGDMAQWLPAIGIRQAAGVDADAVIVPDMSGLAYRLRDEFTALGVPILVVTSEFGTVSMWDWEIRDFLRRRGVDTVTPTSLQEFHDILRAVGLSRRLQTATMLAYQDDLGAGQQPDIFKRFYWWRTTASTTCATLSASQSSVAATGSYGHARRASPSPVSGPRLTTLRTRCLCSGLPSARASSRYACTSPCATTSTRRPE